MKDIIVFNTAIGTFNQGDSVIFDSAVEAIQPLLKDAFVMQLPTHTPALSMYHMFRNSNKYRFVRNCDYKFIMGTNLLTSNIFRSIGQWPVGINYSAVYGESILLGAGITSDSDSNTPFTNKFYQTILRKDVLHSVRDEQSKERLDAIGIKALDTGCPTLWMMNQEKCEKIPQTKAKNVVFTVSGQKKYQNPEQDQKMIKILEKSYDKLYFWAQTYADYPYLQTLGLTKSIELISNLSTFREICNNAEVEYIGTRLHGGIFAMQNGLRSIIVEIDHRAKGFREINHINTIKRDAIKDLENMIHSKIATEIILKEKEIDEWKAQFM